LSQHPINILFLSSWSYNEPLMHSYLLPNLRIIKKMLPTGSICFLQTFEKKNFAIDLESKKIITSDLRNEGIEWIELRYSNFGFRSAVSYPLYILKLIRICKKNKVIVLHPFAPVAGFMALLVRKFYSSFLILDSWEPHAECMLETGVWKQRSLALKVLWSAEKHLASSSDVLLAASLKMKEYALEKWNINPERVYHRPACIDFKHFVIDVQNRKLMRSELNWDSSFVLVCASKLGGLYMRDEVFAFFKMGFEIFGEKFRILFLSEAAEADVKELCDQFLIPFNSIKHLHVSYEEMPKYLQLGDFAFNPQMHVPSKRYGTPVKDGEYWAMGLPLIIMPNISEDSEIVVKQKVGVILKSTSVNDMLCALNEMKDLLETDSKISSRCREVAIKYRDYEIARRAYRNAYTYIQTNIE